MYYSNKRLLKRYAAVERKTKRAPTFGVSALNDNLSNV